MSAVNGKIGRRRHGKDIGKPGTGLGLAGLAAFTCILGFACEVWGRPDNPVDPASVNYQGYLTVADSADIGQVYPSGNASMESALLIVNPVSQATAYELVIADSQAGLETGYLFNKDDYPSNRMDLLEAPLSDMTGYWWKARAKKTDGSWGNWCDAHSFATDWHARAATPSFTPPPGTYPADQSVTLSTVTAFAKIYYTTDGSPPSTSSAQFLGTPIEISGDCGQGKIRTMVVAAGHKPSVEGMADYAIDYSTWTERTSAGQRNWWSIAASGDGSHLAAAVAGGHIWTSSDSGATWIDRSAAGNRSWCSIASDADGSHLASAANLGYIWTSADSGVTWIEHTSSGYRDWRSIASSDDGVHLVAQPSNGYILTSADSGATWTTRVSVHRGDWRAIASSSDGSHLAAASGGGHIFTSTDYGATWIDHSIPGVGIFYAIAASSDGSRLAAAEWGGRIWTSVDSGETWTERTGSGTGLWQAIASSSDGTRLAAAVSGGFIWTSSDSGLTWFARTAPGSRNWSSLSCNASGKEIAVSSYGGSIWNGSLPP